mgnify:CR=1 FL=1
MFSVEKPSQIPTICIGNIVVGGAGKTPVAMKICKMLIRSGYKPHFISKGYASIIKESTLIEPWHSPKSVGDESLLLSEITSTWIGTDRIKSAVLAKKNGADCLIMDDGFQNPSIGKDFSIVVVDGEQEFGNKRVLDTPMCEIAFTGLANGAALMGLRPVVEIQFADFVSTGFDPIVQFASTHHYRQREPLPIVIRAPWGGGAYAGPFHSQCPEAWFVLLV